MLRKVWSFVPRIETFGRFQNRYSLVLICKTWLLGTLALLVFGIGSANAGNATAHLKANRKKFEQKHQAFVRVKDGRIAAIFIQRKKDHRFVFRAFPFGLRNASTADPLKKVSFAKVRKLLKAAAKQRRNHPAVQSAGVSRTGQTGAALGSSSYVTGFPAGYSSSLGATTGDCFNFTVATPNAGVTELSFNSASGVTNFSSVIKASSTINAAYGEFQASNDFSYTGSYQDTANSGQTVFTAESVYDLQPDLDTSNPLNSYGTQQQSAGTFSYQCGDNFITQVPAGALIMGALSWSSTTSTSSTDISDQFSASGSALTNLSVAVSDSLSVSDSITTFNFDLVMDGGGTTAVADMLNTFASNAADFATCTSGTDSTNQSACSSFISNLNAGAATALTAFDGEVSSLGTDLSDFEQFPNGLSGVDGIATTEYFPLSSVLSGISDAFSPYTTQLNTFMTLINQIATLNNRVTLLNNTVGDSVFDPTTFFSLADHLDTLQQVYGTDLGTLLDDMNTCLSSSSSSITTNCDKIINNINTIGGTAIENVQDWYAPAGIPNPNGWSTSQLWEAQQNAIALQYNVTNIWQGKVNESNFPQYQTPMQVLYVYGLPTTFEDSSNSSHSAAQDALVSFVDSSFYSVDVPYSNGPISFPYVVALPISRQSNGEPNNVSFLQWYAELDNLGIIYDSKECFGGDTSSQSTSDCTSIFAVSGSDPIVGPGSSFSSSCFPDLEDVCSFKFGYTDDSYYPQIFFQNFEPIQNFFTPSS